MKSARRQLNGTPAEVEAAFYDALNRGDPDSLMLAWAEDEDIVCVHPGGPRLRGYEEIHASFTAILERGGLDIRPSQVRATQNLVCAVHSVIEGITSNGPEPAHLVATNVYLKTPHGWGMVLHHVSVAPGPAPKGHPPSSLH